ncbi:hypothetical protein [Streptomyces aureus]|uniref:hypothetical protein n=1 Tax=Streptomyces aureus TaxID=193461 RepID=UPI00056BD695|nr:hypothetical protein [Streptomyces aureus]
MEQRIGSKSQPLDAAAVNPAYIPGLTSPVPAEPKDAVAEAEEASAEKAVSDETASDDAAFDGEASGEAPAAEESEESEESASAEETVSADGTESGPVPDGPVFEASDRRASIRADHSGVVLRLDDQEAEFRWDEIGAVETETPRFGKRFTITVHTPERRWYPIEIEANARARHKEWEEQLDAVLDTYFEDGDEDEAAQDAEETRPAAESEASGQADGSESAEPEDKADAKADADAEADDTADTADAEKP